jgi:hypothetical protein
MSEEGGSSSRNWGEIGDPNYIELERNSRLCDIVIIANVSEIRLA